MRLMKSFHFYALFSMTWHLSKIRLLSATENLESTVPVYVFYDKRKTADIFRCNSAHSSAQIWSFPSHKISETKVSGRKNWYSSLETLRIHPMITTKPIIITNKRHFRFPKLYWYEKYTHIFFVIVTYPPFFPDRPISTNLPLSTEIKIDSYVTSTRIVIKKMEKSIKI